MSMNSNRLLQTMAGTAMAIAMVAGAQTPAPPPATPDQAPAPATAPAATPAAPATPPAAPTWSVGPMDISGFVDGYYSLNFNRPASTDGLGDQINQLYDFNDKTDQFELSAAKLTLNHDPDPVGAHVDFVYGRTNSLINAAPTNSTGGDQLSYLEQAFLSLKPPKAKGFEFDFGKFVTSAGAEVIEAKDNWNYSRSLLFVNAIPYWHFGGRTSIPVSKTETIGFQLVNGWNNVSKSNGGVTGVFTSAYVKPKYTWDFNYIIGPENANTSGGLRNLFDTTLLLTPPGKFNVYLNYDFGENNTPVTTYAGESETPTTTFVEKTWQGGAVAFHEQATGKTAYAGRYEYFTDPDGFQTGTAQHLQEFTATYEYKWVEGLLTRVEYRGDFSNMKYFFTDANANPTKTQQQTLTVAFIAFFGPKR